MTAAQERRLLLAALDLAIADVKYRTARRAMREFPRSDTGFTKKQVAAFNGLVRTRREQAHARYLAKRRILRAAGEFRKQAEIGLRPAQPGVRG